MWIQLYEVCFYLYLYTRMMHVMKNAIPMVKKYARGML